MISVNIGAVRPALIVLATLTLSACSTMMPTSSSTPAETAGGKPASMSMKEGMICSCCGKMKEQVGDKAGCCADMKDGCPCCSGMSDGKGMMCGNKDKAAAGGMNSMDHSRMNLNPSTTRK